MFIPNKLFCELLDSAQKIIVLKTFNSEFSFIEVWFTDQNSKPLKIEDDQNSEPLEIKDIKKVTLVIR